MLSTRLCLALSGGLSLLFHLLLFNVANHLPAFNTPSAQKPSSNQRPQSTKLSSVPFTELRQNQKPPPPDFNLTIKETASSLAKSFQQTGLSKLETTKPPPKEPLTRKLTAKVGSTPDLKTPVPSQQLPQNVYHIKASSASQQLPPTDLSAAPKPDGMELKKPEIGDSLSSSSAFPPQNSPSAMTEFSLKRSFPKIIPPDLNFKPQMPKLNKQDITSPVLTSDQNDQVAKQPGEMEFFLHIKPFLYIDEEDEIGYFRLDLSPNNRANDLGEGIDKDVFFLVDSSKSISVSQLASFKQGLISGIQSLSPRDRFNVIDFTTKTVPCFPSMTASTLDNIGTAVDFINDLRSYGKTDVYSSIKPFVTDIVRQDNRPILLYILTDGVSTVSENTENSQIIEKITKSNQQKVSIFGFSCGDDINSFLLDFMTYRNRGDSMIINGLDGAANSLANYIKSHAKILVSDLSYKYMGKNQADVFPKLLPHLYKDKTLSIFGTIDLDEKESIIQVLGSSTTGPRQLIYKLRYDEAQRAGRELAQSWAAQKIFHLIGQLTDGKNSQIVAQISALQQKFDVYIPYQLPK